MDFICPLNEEKKKKIKDMLTERPDYTVEQVNGQRRYYRKDSEVSLDRKMGSEVFARRIPHDAYEDELVPLFEKVAQIRQIRLMMAFSGTNRGYAFVEYFNSNDAKRAIEALDGYQIRPNQSIHVIPSLDKCRLFIGGIPKTKKRNDVFKEMGRVTDGLKDVILYMSVYNNKNRGFCFAEYDTHWAAAMAKRKMGIGFKLWGYHEVRVDWATPEPEVDEKTMNEVTIIHIRNISPNVDETELRQVFTFDGLHIERVKKIRDFAFIHFQSRSDTEIALQLSTDIEFEKNHPNLKGIQVSFARPTRTRDRKTRSMSMESTPTDVSIPLSTPPSQTYFTNVLQMTPDSDVGQQLRYYQSLFQNNIQCSTQVPDYLPDQLMHYNNQLVPIKYDPIVEDKSNCQFFVVWVPIVWLPNYHNKTIE